MNRRTALRAIATAAAAWPMLADAQSSTGRKAATMRVYEGPN